MSPKKWLKKIVHLKKPKEDKSKQDKVVSSLCFLSRIFSLLGMSTPAEFSLPLFLIGAAYC